LEWETFYEGNSWTYSFFVPQDVATLIKMMATETFVSRLDAFFACRAMTSQRAGIPQPLPLQLGGRPDKTASHVRQIIADSYHAGRSGLPGNDDSGACLLVCFWPDGIFPTPARMST